MSESTPSQKSNILIKVGGLLGSIAVITTALATIVNDGSTMWANNPFVKVREKTEASSPSSPEAIVGTYTFRDMYGTNLEIDFHANSSVTLSNGDEGFWVLNENGLYTATLDSRWMFKGLRVEGEQIEGTQISPENKWHQIVGRKQSNSSSP